MVEVGVEVEVVVEVEVGVVVEVGVEVEVEVEVEVGVGVGVVAVVVVVEMNNDPRISQAPALYEALSEGVQAFARDYQSMIDLDESGQLSDAGKRTIKAYRKAQHVIGLISPVGDQFKNWSVIAGDLHEAAKEFKASTWLYAVTNENLAAVHRKLARALAIIGRTAA